jgi:hypothetical protein
VSSRRAARHRAAALAGELTLDLLAHDLGRGGVTTRPPTAKEISLLIISRRSGPGGRRRRRPASVPITSPRAQTGMTTIWAIRFLHAQVHKPRA